MDDNSFCGSPTLGSDDISVRVAESCWIQHEGDDNLNVTEFKSDQNENVSLFPAEQY